MIEFIQTIALLCQISGSKDYVETIEARQLKCQQEYLKCVKEPHADSHVRALRDCILERKLN